MKKVALITFTSNLFNFGLRSIEAYLKSLGHEIFTVNCFTRDDNALSLLSNAQLKILAEKCKDCDSVGLSLISYHNFNRAKQVNNYLMKYTNAKVVLGGVPVTIDPYSYLEFANYVCVGEGETFFHKFLELDDESKIPGLGYKLNNGETHINNLPPLIDINKIPISYFDFKNTYSLPESGISSLAENPQPLYSSASQGYRILPIRGCPYSCTYCCNNQLNKVLKGSGSIVRVSNVERIIKELEYAKKIIPDLKKIYFMEDDFTARKPEEFLNFIAEYQKRICLPFTFYSSPSTFTEEKLNILIKYKAKVEWMKLGLQSASERVNKEIYKRPFNKKNFVDKIELIVSHNINLRLDMILQNPFEKYSDWIENINFFYCLGQRLQKKRLNYKLVTFGLASLRFYPGTELYRKAMEGGIIDESYKEKTLLSRNKYNYGILIPYGVSMLSADLTLILIYYLLMANKWKFVSSIIKKPFVLKCLDKVSKTEMARYSYIIMKPILVRIRNILL